MLYALIGVLITVAVAAYLSGQQSLLFQKSNPAGMSKEHAVAPPPRPRGFEPIATMKIVDEAELEMKGNQSGARMQPVQLAKNFNEFDHEAYEAALKEGKYVFLDFYANWCPICKSESPAIKAAFNALEDDNIIGFQVNFNDNQTDANEKALAKKFNVPYQHAKLVISPNETVLSRSYKGPSSEQEILEQIESAIGQ